MTTLNPPFKAINMDGLYRAVLSGSYPKIPEHFSDDLSKVIRHLLQVDPLKRPSCEQILSSKLVCNYFTSINPQTLVEPTNDYEYENALLKTI
jgi:NIMA (never in mitosis gene a)-related kinase